MTVSQPNVTVNIIPAALEVSNTPQAVLAVGIMLSPGTAVAGTLVQNIQNDGSESTLFGANSMLAQMIREFKKINPVTRIDAIPLANGTTAATGTIALTGPATANGTLEVSVGSSVNHKYEVPVTATDTATTIGDALAALVNADAKCPFTAANVTGTVTLTADNKGTEGNSAALVVSGTIPAGVGVTLTGFASGATNPTLTGVFDVISNKRYQTIIWPGTWTLATLKATLDPRFNVTNNVLDGVGVATLVDTLSNHESAVTALNSASLVYLCVKKLTGTYWKGGTVAELPYVISAQFAAIRSLRLTEDADISQYTISTNGARDSFGGAALASFPYFNTPMPNLPLEPTGQSWQGSDIDALAVLGGSVVGNNITDTSIIMGAIVTTYKTDSAGNSDPTFHYLEYVDTASNCREYFYNNLRKRFAQSRLTEGDLVPNRTIANADVISSYCDKLYGDLSGEEFVLTQAGPTALAFFKANKTVTLDMVNGKAIIVMQTPIVVQLRVILATMQISFST